MVANWCVGSAFTARSARLMSREMFRDTAQSKLALRILRLLFYARKDERRGGGLKPGELFERCGLDDLQEMESVVKVLRAHRLMGAANRAFVITQEGIDYLLKNDH